MRQSQTVFLEPCSRVFLEERIFGAFESTRPCSFPVLTGALRKNVVRSISHEKHLDLDSFPPGAFPTTDLGPSGPARAQPAVESKIYDSPSILLSHPFSLDWHPTISGNRPDGSGGVPIPRLFGGGEPVSEKAVGVLWRTEDQTALHE